MEQVASQSSFDQFFQGAVSMLTQERVRQAFLDKEITGDV